MKSTLTDAIEKISKFYRVEERMPSYSEICTLLDYKSKNAAFRLVEKLIETGVLAKSSGGKLIPKSMKTALKVLGTVQAGFPTAEEESHLKTLSLDEHLMQNPAESFLLRVSGDSMIDAGIREGDMVIVDRKRSAKNGDIVVAEVDGDWTLKFFEKKGTTVRLIPANKNYPVLTPRQELKIGGVVVSVVRRYF